MPSNYGNNPTKGIIIVHVVGTCCMLMHFNSIQANAPQVEWGMCAAHRQWLQWLMEIKLHRHTRKTHTHKGGEA